MCFFKSNAYSVHVKNVAKVRMRFAKILGLFSLLMWEKIVVAIIHVRSNYTVYSEVEIHLASLYPDCIMLPSEATGSDVL